MSLFVFSASAASTSIDNDLLNYDYGCQNGYGEEWSPSFHNSIEIGFQNLNLNSGSKISFYARSKTLNLSGGYTYKVEYRFYYNFAMGNPPISMPYIQLVHSGGETEIVQSYLIKNFQASGGNYYDYEATFTVYDSVALEIGFNYTARYSVSGGYFFLSMGTPIIQTPINDDVIANQDKNKDEIIANQDQNKDEIIANQDANTEKVGGWLSQLGNSIQGWFSDLLNGILDGLKALFIPPQEKLDAFFTALNEWMDDHFGFLYYPFSVLIDFCNRLLTFTPPENPTITFPALTIGEYTLMESQEYNLGTDALPGMAQFRQWYVIGVNCIIGFWLVNLARKKLASIMGGGDDA